MTLVGLTDTSNHPVADTADAGRAVYIRDALLPVVSWALELGTAKSNIYGTVCPASTGSIPAISVGVVGCQIASTANHCIRKGGIVIATVGTAVLYIDGIGISEVAVEYPLSHITT